MLKESKTSNNSQSKAILKDLPSMFLDLLQKMLTINPKRRITIEGMLAHEVVKPFHKPEE
jgi:serine/threonine protein kinase